MYKISITGKANSGKNTLASLLKKHFNYSDNEVSVVAFADPIKEIVLKMFPEASYDCLYGPSKLRSLPINEKYKDKDGNILTHRQALIDVGTLARKYNENVLVDIAANKLKSIKDKNLFITPDARFINELSWLKSENFFKIKIVRDLHTKINDVSENQQDLIKDEEYDIVIHNNDTIDIFEDNVKNLVSVVSRRVPPNN
jgi:hypothetical protein